ncbi:hypothetical protein KPH14_005693 [Odynerus spinipes]|uniref:MORN repeat-containing protein 3 n=1 Tax=Odynerus spinipes TaxID=1348599 RepID=A0AAD9VJT6_9HYME|nr:hypothetical protein KPH14_005693 [Odynerus spinipes]
MPFLKCVKPSVNKEKLEKSKKIGSRHSIYAPRTKRFFKQHYKGEWENDLMVGKGMEIDSDGWMYEGDWFDGRKHGYGVLSKISKDGSIRKVYAGDWITGKKNGFASYWYENGDYFEGYFYRDKRHGYGRMWYKNCDYYQGFWKDDLPNGKGMLVKGSPPRISNKKMFYVFLDSLFLTGDGNRYEGCFTNGKRHGLGTFYHLDSGQRQRGCWNNDFCVSSIMEDINWRQSALHPTEYAIPQIYLSEISY